MSINNKQNESIDDRSTISNTIPDKDSEIPLKNQAFLKPLSKDEKVQAQQITVDNKKDELTILIPIPDDAKPFTKDTPEYFNKQFKNKPSHIHHYYNQDGKLLGNLVRWDRKQPDGTIKKETRPYVYVEFKNGTKAWISKGLPTPRPLYNILDIVKNPEKTILIVEGEKTVEAAKSLFSDWVITTSIGGANAAHSTDWYPLKERKIIICPDNDEAGTNYGDTVCSLLKKINVNSIQYLSVQELIEKTLKIEKIKKGYDLADAVQDGLTDKILEQTNIYEYIVPYITKTDKLNAALPKGFRISNKGCIEYLVNNSEKESLENKEWVFLCTYFIAAYEARDKKNKSWVKIFYLIDKDGCKKEVTITPTMIAGDKKCLIEFLLSEGADVNHSQRAKDKLVEYIARSNPKARLRSVNKIGWYDNSHYILPNKTYGKKTTEIIRLQSDGKLPEFQKKGSLEEWNQNIGRYAVDNYLLQTVILQSLTAPLLTPLNRENFGLHLLGNSSSGKSTALHVACSVYGSEFRTWRTTDNAAESWGLSSNDNILILDDLKQGSAKTVEEMTYMLGNGQGKARSDRNGIAKEVTKFNICFLSTGEISVESRIKENDPKKSYHAGQAIRLLEVFANAGKDYGVFDTTHDFKDGASLSRHLKQASYNYCGSLGDAWLNLLTNNLEEIKQLIKQYEQKFDQQVCLNQKIDGQVERAKGHFSLMAAAGEVAIKFGLLNWSINSAIIACKKVFDDWLACRGGTESFETLQAIKDIYECIEKHGSSRFENAWAKKPFNKQTSRGWELSTTDDIQKISNNLGFRKPNNTEIADRPEEWTYYFHSSGLEEVLKGKDKKVIVSALVKKGVIVPDKDGKSTISIHIPGEKQKRLYQIAKEK